MYKSKQSTRVHLLPAFHFDLAYCKTFEEYLPVGLQIMRAAVKLLGANLDYTFCVEQVALLRAYWEKYPRDRRCLRAFAASGRLVCAPGMLTMPDSNIPSGENFIRNALLGRTWLREHLRVAPDCCWMADIFGHNPQSPQLAKTCGYSSYMFERGKCGSWDTAFQWRGLDGTLIDAQWELDTYYGINLALAWRKIRPAEWVRRRLLDLIVEPLREHVPAGKAPAILFTKDGGDFLRPDQSRIDFVRAWNRRQRQSHLLFSTPARYWAELRRARRRLPVRSDDLNPLHEGCWSSRIRLKQYNRRLEETAAELEMLEFLAGTDNRGSARLWETLAWNAFHDIICGSLVTKALREALALYAKAERQAHIRQAALVKRLAVPFMRGIEGRCHFVFNSLPYPRREIVALSGGNGVPCFAEAFLPPAGFAIITSTALPGKIRGRVQVREGGRVLENDLISLRLGVNGTIISLFDKQFGNELALPTSGMNNPLRQPDYGDPWILNTGPVNGAQLRTAPVYDPPPLSSSAVDRETREHRKASDADCCSWPRPKIWERHPLQATVEIQYPELCWTTRITLRAGEKLVRFQTLFVPHGKKYRLRVAFPVAISKGVIRHSVPCGHIRRPEGEYACQGWLDYASRDRGLLVLNRGLPGNNVTANTVMISLFRGISMEAHEKVSWYEEGVSHLFEYAVMPFKPGDPAYQPARLAALYQRPPLVHVFTGGGRRGDDRAALPPPTIELRGHPAELICVQYNGRDLRLRCWETAGRIGTVDIVLHASIAGCRRTDAVGNDLGAVAVQGGHVIRLKMRSFEVATLLVHFPMSGGFPA